MLVASIHHYYYSRTLPAGDGKGLHVRLRAGRSSMKGNGSTVRYAPPFTIGHANVNIQQAPESDVYTFSVSGAIRRRLIILLLSDQFQSCWRADSVRNTSRGRFDESNERL
jgi:hypothetical protein